MDNLKRSADDDSEHYELQQVKRQRLEDKLNSGDKREKVIGIIKREFENEISKRQEEIELIQQRLLKAQKTLHLLKYVIVKSFYDKKELNVERDKSVTNNKASLYDLKNCTQNRIHPAVKKLLGKKPIENLCFDFARTRGQSQSIISPIIKIEPNEDKFKENICHNLNIKEESVTDNIIIKEEVDKDSIETDAPVRHRQRISHEIVIGNISKYVAPNNPQDNSTHKWMMYVRGPRQNPDISHIVKKVRFFLHPSYQPIDVIEIEEPPFHLSRRGWGEFPLRVQIHFHNRLNKPVDIIHNLKLDQNRTGRQTLGNETVINVWLYDSSSTKDSSSYNEYVNEEKNEEVVSKKETIHIKEELNQRDDYNDVTPGCSKYDLYACDDTEENENVEESSNLKDESDDKNDKNDYVFEPHEKIVNQNRPKSQILLKNSNRESTDKTFKDYNLIYLVDHCYTNIKLDELPLFNMCNTETNIIDPKKYEFSIPVQYFTNIRQIIYFLFKSLPLVTTLATDISYKCCYPYVAITEEEFLSWNYPKRCCAEWYRAKHIKKMLQEHKVEEEEEWTIKFIIMFGRAHAFTPAANYSIFQNKNESGKTLPNQDTDCEVKSTLTEYIPIAPLMENMHLYKTGEDENCEVDVETLDDLTEEKPITNIPTHSSESNPNLLPLCNYVKECAAQLDINLEDEEIEPEILHNSVERVILQSVMCLAEELIRTAWANKVIDRQGRNLKNSEVERNDILKVLVEREEFDIFTNKGLGKIVT